jgi:hypothetical protein
LVETLSHVIEEASLSEESGAADAPAVGRVGELLVVKVLIHGRVLVVILRVGVLEAIVLGALVELVFSLLAPAGVPPPISAVATILLVVLAWVGIGDAIAEL